MTVVELSETAELDRLIFETDTWWALPVSDQAALRHRLVTRAVRHHLEHNRGYRDFAEAAGFDVDTCNDLSRVPQVPTTVFKRTDLRSTAAADCSLFVSSGTSSGTRSRVWRDDTTLQRLVGSLRPDGDIWGDLYRDVDLDSDGTTLHLGPSRVEAKGVWISYVMTMIEMFTATTHYLRDGVLHVAAAAQDLRRAVASGEFVAIAGPPVFVAELLHHLDDRDLRCAAGDRVVVITGGGWKKDQTTRVDPAALRDLAVRVLGLRSAEQVRDVFNQVELNTAFVECEHHNKHVPPWVEVVVRDPADLSPLPAGTTGLLSYVDPSATSYPCFLLSEDFGAIEVDRCPCGRRGTTVTPRRRLAAATHHGCALRLATTTRLG
jgi:long-chain-fatty-acid---luciferin-component ligase